jgi:hypothetical protein
MLVGFGHVIVIDGSLVHDVLFQIIITHLHKAYIQTGKKFCSLRNLLFYLIDHRLHTIRILSYKKIKGVYTHPVILDESVSNNDNEKERGRL